MENNPDRDNPLYWQDLKKLYTKDKDELSAYLDSVATTLPHETDTGLLLFLRARLTDGLPIYAPVVMDNPHHFIEDMKYLNTLEYYHDLPRLIADCDESLEDAKKAQADKMTAAKGATTRTR